MMDDCDYRIPYFEILEDVLDVAKVPFTERGSRILVGLEHSSTSKFAAAPDEKGLVQDGGLEVRMAERWGHLERKLGNHRKRAPLIEGLRPTDGNGGVLPFRLHTWPHKLLLQTSVGDFEIFFGDRETLYISLPGDNSGLSFSVMAERFFADERGGILDGPRLFALTTSSTDAGLRVIGGTNGRLFIALDAQAEVRGVLAVNVPESNQCSRTIHPTREVIAGAEQSWKSWFEAVPKVSKEYWREYYYAWMILRNGLLSPAGHLKREALAPSKTHYLGVWHWDAYFHALAYRHVDTKLAQGQLWALLDHQLDNGLIPDVVHDEGLITREDGPNGRDLTKPPLIAWSALKLFESGLGRDFLRDVYEPMVRWNNWWFEQCDDDCDGIAQYNHPYSSGLDDSPLWDVGTPIESPDLNTYLCVHMQSLASIARIIGRKNEAEDWDIKAREMARLTSSHFYDESAGVFWAMKDHLPIRVLTPFNLLPIWTGLLPHRQVRAAVRNLASQGTFWTEFGVPTVSRSDSRYDPERMWRGPTWVNVNYMLIEALSRTGYTGLADTLADRTIDLVMRSGVAEYFNSVTGEVPARAAPAFGWSAALFVDLVIRRTRGRPSSRFRMQNGASQPS